MSADHPNQTGANQPPQAAPSENGVPGNQQSDEPSFVNLYRELTGATELEARGVFMFAIHDNEQSGTHLPR